MNKLLFSILLVFIGIAGRTIYHISPNIELVTAATLISGYYLGWKHAVFVPFLIMALSDLLIGNSSIFIFTWSAYIITGIFSSAAAKVKFIRKTNIIISGTVIGLASSLWFYLWTNFGVWLLDSWSMYSNDLNGLLRSYVSGIPFLKNNLLSNLLILPLSFFIAEKVRQLSKVINWNNFSENL